MLRRVVLGVVILSSWFGPRRPIEVRKTVEVRVPYGFLMAHDTEDQLSGY